MITNSSSDLVTKFIMYPGSPRLYRHIGLRCSELKELDIVTDSQGLWLDAVCSLSNTLEKLKLNGRLEGIDSEGRNHMFSNLYQYPMSTSMLRL